MVCAGCGTSSASTDTRCRSCGRRLPVGRRDVATGVLTPVPVPNETNVPNPPGDETLMGAFAGNAPTAEWIPAGRATPAGPSKAAVPSSDDAVTGVNLPPGADVTRQSTISTGDAATGVFTPGTGPQRAQCARGRDAHGGVCGQRANCRVDSRRACDAGRPVEARRFLLHPMTTPSRE